MILSRVSLPLHDLQRTVDLLSGGLYAEHKLLWHLFPDQPAATRDFLYRRETRDSSVFFYLLSHRTPEPGITGLDLQSKTFAPQLVAGDLLRFELRANAVRTTHDGSGSKRRRRRDIVEAALDDYRRDNVEPADSEQIRQSAGAQWLQAQGARGGFSPRSVSVSNHRFLSVEKPGEKAPIRFAQMDYTGVLEVTEPELFLQKTVANGLGRSKSFGCGLVMISRA